MKKIKRIFIVICALAVTNISVFAASGFEAIVNVPLGLSFGVSEGLHESLTPKSAVGFDSGVTAQLGYMIGLGKIGISILGELGYSYDSYRVYYTGKVYNGFEGKMTTGLHTHSFQIGLLPKINIGSFAIGVGAGVKIPVSAYSTSKIDYSIPIIGDGTINSGEVKLNRDDIENYDRNVIPYLKVTFDYSFFFGNKMAFNIGAYLGGDFGLANKNPANDKYIGVNSFDIGLQLGFRFAPKL